MDLSVILACGGKSIRFGSDKLFAKLNGHTVIEETVSKFLYLNCPIVISCDKEKIDEYKKLFPSFTIVEGGANRSQSVFNALKQVKTKYVLIHDGARPFITQRDIDLILYELEKKGSAVAAFTLTDSIVNVAKAEYEDRDNFQIIQTPQAFITEDILSCYDENTDAKDDSSLYFEKYEKVNFVLGSRNNIKVTYKEDLYKYSIGIDLHKLEKGDGIVLGGIAIPCEYSTIAHSDGDVVLHSIMNACLSSIGKRDIGYYFKDTDPKYENADSKELLKEVIHMMNEENVKLSSLSITIELQEPKLSPHIEQIKVSLSRLLNVEESEIGICATTGEGIGDIGNNKAIKVTTIINVIPK